LINSTFQSFNNNKGFIKNNPVFNVNSTMNNRKNYNYKYSETQDVIRNSYPIIFTLAHVANTKGSFGKKIISGVDMTKNWAIFIILIKAISDRFDKNPKYQKFKEDSPAKGYAIQASSSLLLGIAGFETIRNSVKFLLKDNKTVKKILKSTESKINNVSNAQNYAKFIEKIKPAANGLKIAGIVGISGMFIHRTYSLSKQNSNL